MSCLQLVSITTSTNQLAMERSQAGRGAGFVCAAEKQTGGRGRRGRSWYSPYGKNLYFSLVAEFSGGAAALEGLSLAVAVIVAEALAEMKIEPIRLKWPNDILCHGKKLAGILMEMTGDASGLCQVVVGIGINVDMPGSAEEVIDQPWIDLVSITQGDVSRNTLLSCLLDKLLPMLTNYEDEGFARYRQRWLALDAYAGELVSVRQGDQEHLGFARGIDETGALLLEVAGDIQVFNGGEVSLRKRHDSGM